MSRLGRLCTIVVCSSTMALVRLMLELDWATCLRIICCVLIWRGVGISWRVSTGRRRMRCGGVMGGGVVASLSLLFCATIVDDSVD